MNNMDVMGGKHQQSQGNNVGGNVHSSHNMDD